MKSEKEEFWFHLDDVFFQTVDGPEIKSGDLKAHLLVRRTSGAFEFPAATAEQTQKQNTISLSITCKNAIHNGILDDPNYADVLPQNGVIFSSSAVQIESGDTVMQVVKSTLKSNKIVYQIGSDGYIKSIAGLGEFDCGAQSGWLYKVNGVKPSISTRYYTLQPGDQVELIYTCKQGDVS